MTITLNGTTGITTPDITSSGALGVDASAPDNSLVVDSSGNVGAGVTPSAWGGSYKALQFPSGAIAGYSTTAVDLYQNAYDSGAGAWKYLASGQGATRFASYNGSYQWHIAPSGTAGAAISFTQAMTLDASGNLLVGTTSAISVGKISLSFAGSTQNGITLKTTRAATGSDYMQFFNSAGTVAGRITQSGTTTVSYTTSSDYRLKENIAPMTGALARVSALKPVTYTWKADGSADEGFIAHELQEVCPSAVCGEKDAVDADGNPVYQGIDTSFLVATLTAAIQEQQAIIEEQKTALIALTARVEALEGATT